jgi:hypothetical protein
MYGDKPFLPQAISFVCFFERRGVWMVDLSSSTVGVPVAFGLLCTYLLSRFSRNFVPKCELR